MRKPFMSDSYLPSSVRPNEGSQKKPHGGSASFFQEADNSPSTKWDEPWLAMGQSEPGWWRAFAIDHGVRSTRTPDKLIRKPQETNVFDLPTGEPMEAGRLAEVAMNKPKEEIHKRIEKLRAALEAPPLGTFPPRAANPPPIAAARPQVATHKVAAIEAEMPRKVDASTAETAQTVLGDFGADRLPQAEPPMTALLLPQMTMFTPSAFQATLYRIDVSLKRAIDVRTPEGSDITLGYDPGQSVGLDAAAVELQEVGSTQASGLGLERHAAVAAIADVETAEEIAGSSKMEPGSEIGCCKSYREKH